MFLNTMTNKMETSCTETRNGRWYIKGFFCGCNSPANNRLGYVTQTKAEQAALRYQNKIPKETMDFYLERGRKYV